MTKILLGKPVADVIREDIAKRVKEMKEKGIYPTLAVVRVGNNINDLSYERGLRSTCQSVDVDLKVYELSETVTNEGVLDVVQELNGNPSCHGILIFRPLPNHLNADLIGESIIPRKDIDCMTKANLSKVFFNDYSGILPATPLAVLELLKFYNIPLKGQHISIVNRSMVLGKPLALLLLSENATVTVCHSKTQNLQEMTRLSDIIILGTGQAKKFGKNYFTKDSVVIDVGINEDEDGNLCGDADFDELNGVVNAVTPVPRGIGSITNSVLLSQLITSIEKN